MLNPTKSAIGFLFWASAFGLGAWIVGSTLARESLGVVSQLDGID